MYPDEKKRTQVILKIVDVKHNKNELKLIKEHVGIFPLFLLAIYFRNVIILIYFCI